MSRRRNGKIKFSHENYLSTLSESEQNAYTDRFAPLIAIMDKAEGDVQIMALAKAYDAEHETDFFQEAVNMKIYCIACQKVECDCCF